MSCEKTTAFCLGVCAYGMPVCLPYCQLDVQREFADLHLLRSNPQDVYIIKPLKSRAATQTGQAAAYQIRWPVLQCCPAEGVINDEMREQSIV